MISDSTSYFGDTGNKVDASKSVHLSTGKSNRPY